MKYVSKSNMLKISKIKNTFEEIVQVNSVFENVKGLTCQN